MRHRVLYIHVRGCACVCNYAGVGPALTSEDAPLATDAQWVDDGLQAAHDNALGAGESMHTYTYKQIGTVSRTGLVPLGQVWALWYSGFVVGAYYAPTTLLHA